MSLATIPADDAGSTEVRRYRQVYHRSGPDHAVSQGRKAAMVVQMILAGGKPFSLARLPEEVQLRLARELGQLRLVDRVTLHAVAQEFAQRLDQIGMTAPNGVEGAIAALGSQISPAAAARLKSEAGAALGAQDPWAQVVTLDPDDLVTILTEESIEVAAVVLSKLEVSRAADLLGRLPGERARRITLAICQTGDIRPEAVARIGAALAIAHGTRPQSAFAHPPVQRVGAILNSSLAATRDSVLEGLGTDAPDFADQVRKAIFTFDDVPARVAPVDVPKVIRAVDPPVLVTGLTFALAAGGPTAEAADFILVNMSQRMADSLREEIADRGRIRPRDGEGALSRLVTEVRRAADAGEIALIRTEDDD